MQERLEVPDSTRLPERGPNTHTHAHIHTHTQKKLIEGFMGE